MGGAIQDFCREAGAGCWVGVSVLLACRAGSRRPPCSSAPVYVETHFWLLASCTPSVCLHFISHLTERALEQETERGSVSVQAAAAEQSEMKIKLPRDDEVTADPARTPGHRWPWTRYTASHTFCSADSTGIRARLPRTDSHCCSCLRNNSRDPKEMPQGVGA